MNGFGSAIAAVILCLGLFGCGSGSGTPEVLNSADVEDRIKQQIELHLQMAEILDKVSDRRTYQAAAPVLDSMKKASEELHNALANLPSEQTTSVVERYAKEFQAARLRLEEAKEKSRNRLLTKLPDLNAPKK
ncbi:MAG: hypothetical protein HY040_00360 [Planctomycetes bacterium]|nr:hypothetical protein [Planctomycetota bacterium]